MTRSELVKKLSEIYPFMHIENAEKIVSIMFDTITNALCAGKRVEIRGFGAFEVRRREKTKCRNPKTGAPVVLKERKVPFFKAGKFFKDYVNKQCDMNGQSNKICK